MNELKDILDKLVVDCCDEYLKLHTNTQEFAITNARIDYYEAEAMQKIIKLFSKSAKGGN